MSKYITAAAVILLYALPLFSQNTWVSQPSGYTENFKKVVFADSLYGWISCDSGMVIHTTNGGQSWTTQLRNPSDYINDIFFLNRLNGWLIVWRVTGGRMNSLVYSTTNGGGNWTAINYADSLTLLNSVYFISPQSGFIGTTYTSNKSILRSTNGGTNWFPANVDTNFAANFPVKTIRFLNANTGYAAGGILDVCGVIWKTTDGGNSWTSNSNGGEPNNSIGFPNQNTVVISGGDYEYGASVCYSGDSGASWHYYFTGYFGIGYSLSFRTETEGWIASGFSRLLLKSTDSGLSWTSTDTPDSTYIYSLVFPNQKTGWAVGDNGAILKYTASPIGISNTGSTLPASFLLGQNYPNPFNPVTKIKFSVPPSLSSPHGVGGDLVQLKVYDVRGREVQTLVNERLNAGTYEATFDGSSLNSGVYFYRLTTEGFSETRRMILLK